MKKVLLFLPIIAMVLYSCGSDKSGERKPSKLARVREVDTNQVNWVRLNLTEASVYKIGDTLTINTMYHNVSYERPTEEVLELKKVYIESFETGKN